MGNSFLFISNPRWSAATASFINELLVYDWNARDCPAKPPFFQRAQHHGMPSTHEHIKALKCGLWNRLFRQPLLNQRSELPRQGMVDRHVAPDRIVNVPIGIKRRDFVRRR